METLRTARQVLEAALDNYTDACLALADSSGSGFTFNHAHNITELMNTEFESYTIFEARVTRVKRLLGRTRNTVTSLVPIHSLPDDILLHIFRLVMNKELLDFEALVDQASPRPTILATSQVCIRWRRVVLSSKSLWADIELSIRKNLFPICKIFADRSEDLSLNVRVIEPFQSSNVGDRRSVTPFFSRIGRRVASFELAITPPLDAELEAKKAYLYILSSCLKHWQPGHLTRLIISDRNSTIRHRQDYESPGHWFLFPRTSVQQRISGHGKAIRLDVDAPRFEDVLAQVKILELDIIYPFWASKAYHGLVELRLTGPLRLTTVITIQELASILVASPRLRVLNFGLEVSLAEIFPQSVNLADLEIFILRSLHHDSQQAVLQLVTPGKKSLQMSTVYNKPQLQRLPAQFDDEFQRFFRRSNISYLEIIGQLLPVELPGLLRLLPDLQTLILRQVDIKEVEPSNDEATVPVCPQLRSLHIGYGYYHLETLRWIASQYSLQEFTLYTGMNPGPKGGYRTRNEFIAALRSTCPFIQILDTDTAVGMKDRVLSFSDTNNRETSAYVTDYRLY